MDRGQKSLEEWVHVCVRVRKQIPLLLAENWLAIIYYAHIASIMDEKCFADNNKYFRWCVVEQKKILGTLFFLRSRNSSLPLFTANLKANERKKLGQRGFECQSRNIREEIAKEVQNLWMKLIFHMESICKLCDTFTEIRNRREYWKSYSRVLHKLGHTLCF